MSNFVLETRELCKSYFLGKDELPILKNIDFTVPHGDYVSIMGHSGAGKSTILNLLPRFYDPQKGLIKIDNQNISRIRLSSLRKNISLVSQDTILFDATIKENIAYANESASQKEIENACEFAAASEFINKLPNKFDTMIGENGIKISGGQRQRLSLARAFFRGAKV